MKDTLVQIGLVVLGALIVVNLIFGMMKEDVEGAAKAGHQRMESITAPIK
ncbi:hypothetical protein LAV72_18690 [Lysinibacillus xylanilyticus]|nr:hypothetical protein [Lysinibacillus xylanilyticus]MEB2301635.1 hypothetical protein [Lysinibacillus xylanilyticus]